MTSLSRTVSRRMRESGSDCAMRGRVRYDITESSAGPLKGTWHWDRGCSPHTSSAAGSGQMKGTLPCSEVEVATGTLPTETRLPGNSTRFPRTPAPSSLSSPNPRDSSFEGGSETRVCCNMSVFIFLEGNWNEREKEAIGGLNKTPVFLWCFFSFFSEMVFAKCRV